MARPYVPLSSQTEQRAFIDSVQRTNKDATSATLAQALTNSFGYLEFLLQRTGHAFAEKVEVIERVADAYVACFLIHSSNWSYARER